METVCGQGFFSGLYGHIFFVFPLSSPHSRFSYSSAVILVKTKKWKRDKKFILKGVSDFICILRERSATEKGIAEPSRTNGHICGEDEDWRNKSNPLSFGRISLRKLSA